MGDKVTFGDYRVLQRDDGSLWELGRSAMGVTYKALDMDLQRPVALKVINADLVADEVSRDRFLREVRASAGLRHSHIASIYHFGKEEDQFFYAMEFIEGQTAESHVARFGPMPLRAALCIAWQVSKALAAATRQELHRDIKPANIMIVADSEEGAWPFVKLIDFGLPGSVRAVPDSDGATQAEFVGIDQSRAPEQIQEGNMDARSDIHSLGCTLWYLLTGQAPFADSPTSGLAQPVGDELPWACRVWSLFTGEGPVTGSVTSALAQQRGGEPAWERLKPFPGRIRRLLRWMLREESSPHAASAVQLQREIEQCLAEVERRETLAARIALPLDIGGKWLTDSAWPRRAVIFGASGIGLVLAFGYYWNSDTPLRNAPASQTGDVVRAPVLITPNQWLAREMPRWSYLGAWDEPFRSSALAPRLSFGETVAADPGVIGATSWAHASSIWDGGVVAKDDSLSGKAGDRSSASGESLAVAGSEGKKAAVRKAPVRNKSQVKKTTKRYAYGNYAKKPQRRVTSRARDQGFDPLRVVRQAREQIRRVIRRIL